MNLETVAPGRAHIAHCFTFNWGGWTRTTNFLINSQAVCQLTYAPSVQPYIYISPPAAFRRNCGTGAFEVR